MSLRRNKEEGKKNKVEIVLFTSVRGCGKPGSVVKVARGFARNHLIPRGFADYATAVNLKKLETEREKLAVIDTEQTAQAQALKAKVEGLELPFYCKVRDRENIYGSIQSKDIVESLKEKGIEVSKSQVVLSSPLKVLGRYDVKLVLYGEVDATIHACLQSVADKPV